MAHKDKTKSVNDALSTFHEIPVTDFVLTKRTSLHKDSEAPATLMLDFDFDDGTDDVYSPGDHLR